MDSIGRVTQLLGTEAQINEAATRSGLDPSRAENVGTQSRGAALNEIYRDSQVRIVSDEALSPAAGRALAGRIEKAYRFDAEQQHWKDPSALGKVMTVAALSRELFAQVTGDLTGSVAGVTTGPDVIVVPSAIATRGRADDDVTLAHELGHVQDLREAGKRISQVPIYLQEGKEYLLGDRYPLSQGVHPPSLRSVSQELAGVTGEQAREVMKTFRTVRDEGMAGREGFRDEVVGALFVEFLRTRLKGGAPEAIPKVAEVISQVGGGATYAAAFKDQFGVTSAQAEAAFIAYVEQTEGRPRERLRGTLYA